MSDLKLWSQKQKTFKKAEAFSYREIEKILSEDGESLLGIKILVTNYALNKERTDYLPALGLDSQKQLVLIEYRQGKYSQIIGRGLMQLDYIEQNESQFRLLMKDLNLDKDIIYKPRLLIIGEDFSEYDYYAIRQLPYPIELIRFQTYAKDLIVLHKHFVSKRTQIINFNSLKENESLLNELIEFVYSLGDEVVGLAYKQSFVFRKIKSFLSVDLSSSLSLKYKLKNKEKTSIIKTTSDLLKLQPILEELYNEG